MRKGLQAAVMAAAVGTAMALSAGQAHAATGVTANSDFIDITAAAGKRNEIFINPSGGNVIITDFGDTVTDFGDTVTAGDGCTQRTSNSVTCPSGTRTILLSAGDLGDTVTLRANLRASISGKTGNDILTVDGNVTERVVLGGDEGNDTLGGGSGPDEIVGGGGNDTMFGNAGNDRLTDRDGLGGNDSTDGGPGSDVCPVDVGDRRVSCEG